MSSAVRRDEAGAGQAAARQKPVIGIPAPVEEAQWRWLKGRAHLMGTVYTDHFHRAGASIALLPVPGEGMGASQQDADDLISRVDGLVIAGGSDIEPSRYGQLARPESGPFDSVRDEWETMLTQAAITAEVPVFGICRGLQVMNVALGGTLIQHLPSILGGSEIHNPIKDGFGTHSVRTVADSWLRAAVGEVADIATYHHQAVDRLAEGFTVTAVADDGTIEGIEDLSRGLIGVQWHPEVREHEGVFREFVSLCEEHRDARHPSFKP